MTFSIMSQQAAYVSACPSVREELLAGGSVEEGGKTVS